MKIQFIVVGWWYEKYQEFIDQLIDLNKHEQIDVFWSCHKEPPATVKNNFNYKTFPNIGLEDGAYHQALEYLNLSDDTICFFTHDDIIVKDWEFINECIKKLNQGYKVIGNGQNYPMNFNPYGEVNGYNKKHVDFVKEECKYLFNTTENVKTIRLSFMCTLVKTIKELKGFEVIWEVGEPVLNEKQQYTINDTPYSGIGNLQQALFSYKIHKIFGPNAITYLSNNYQDSNFLFECVRGKSINS
jgi:hypothetical protein